MLLFYCFFWLHAPEFQLSPEPMLRLGSEKSEAALFLQKPISLALNQDGELYILDSGQGMIFKVSLDGELLTTIGGQGRGPGEFYKPMTIALVDNYLWVADFGNGRAQIFKDDQYLKTVKVQRPAAPYNIVAMNREVFLAGRSVDAQYGPVVVFSPQGEQIRQLSWAPSRNRSRGQTAGIWNRLTLTPLSKQRLLAGYLYDNAMTVIDDQGSVILDKEMGQIYERYEDNRGVAVFPAGFAAMAFSGGPDNTVFVSVCDQERRYCGVIYQLDASLVNRLKRFDMGFSVSFMRYEAGMNMLLMTNTQAEVLIYTLD